MAETGNKLRVLIADDERIIANTLATILNRSGYDAHAVYSGETAIEAARKIPPDVLISDVIMFGMNGIDASRQIVSLVPDCRVILFSGQAATAGLIERAAADGHHFEVVAKPVHPVVLLNLLKSNAA